MIVYKKLQFLLLVVPIILVMSACSDSIHNELGVSADEPPSFKEEDRREGTNKTFIKVELSSEGSGEEDARQLIADSFKELKEEYRIAAIKLVDQENEDWYGVYMEDDTVINYITASPKQDLRSEEKALVKFYETIEDPDFPLIRFSEEPILLEDEAGSKE